MRSRVTDDTRQDGLDAALLAGARGGHADVCRFLVSRGAEAKTGSADRWGRTPLHMAVIGGSLETVRFFIGEGADIEARSRFGATPLHSAALSGASRELVELLMDFGADKDPSPRNHQGSTPVDVAVANGHHGTAEALSARGGRRGRDLSAPD